MKKTAVMIILAVLAVTCFSAAMADQASDFGAMLNGIWVCVNADNHDVKSFVYPSSDAVLTTGGTGAVYLIALSEQAGGYVSGEITFNEDGTLLAVLPFGQSSPIVYQKDASSEPGSASLVGEWVADSEYGIVEFTFNEDGTCLMTNGGSEIAAQWELDDGRLIFRTDVDGFEVCVCPFDGNSFDCSALGVEVFAYRK